MPTKTTIHSDTDLLDQLTTAVIVLDDTLRVRFLNASAEQLLGASMSRVVGRQLIQIVNLPDELLTRLRDAAQSGYSFTDVMKLC